MPRTRIFGFTLSELLISLAILGVIATFSIPKILTAQQNAASNAKAKEAVAMISGAYQQYKANNTVNTSFNIASLLPYINYTTIDTAGTNSIDYHPTLGASVCNAATPCIRLHNGAVIMYNSSDHFCGTSGNTGVVFFYFDPDGVYSGTTADGPSKSVVFWLYPDAAIKTYGTLRPGVVSGDVACGSSYPQTTAYDPSWFSW